MQRDFRTILYPTKQTLELNHQSKVYLTGSCFAENIGQKLMELKFRALVNPFGISYNPISIHKTLCLNSSTDVESTMVEGVHFSYDVHSVLNSTTKEGFQENLQMAIDKQKEHLKAKGTIILSYGTAWVYEKVADGEIANNCHKQPSKLFTKRLLSVNEIVESWNITKSKLENNYPEHHFIFTVSPVRHLKDGFHENQLSKSTLQLAVNEICKQHINCSYFPAYEIVLDDLRDYRFFKDDLLHPNQFAVDYIWEYFSDSYFSKGTKLLNQQIEKFNISLQHRAFQPDSAKHQQFLLNLKSKIKAFQLANDLDFQTEIDFIKSQIV